MASATAAVPAPSQSASARAAAAPGSIVGEMSTATSSYSRPKTETTPPSPELPCDFAAEDRQPQVALHQALMTPPGDLSVLGEPPQVQPAVAQQGVEVRIPQPDRARLAGGQTDFTPGSLGGRMHRAGRCRQRRGRQRERPGLARGHFLRASSRIRPVAVGSATPASFARVGAMSAGEAAASYCPDVMPAPSRISGTCVS